MEEKDEPPDPGWRPALKYLIFLLFLPLILWGVRRWGDSRLVALRGAYLTFSLAVLDVLLVNAPLERDPAAGRATTTTSIIVFTAVAVLPLLAALPVRRATGLSCDDDHKLASSLATLSFLGFAFAASPALLGFVGTFIFQALWPSIVGLAISLPGLALFAPTGREIARCQAWLEAKGCERSLRRALSESPPSFRGVLR